MRPPRRKPATAEASRLTVLAATDEQAFVALALDLLGSRDRLQREAALEALAQHPAGAARDALRALYFELDANGTKADQGAKLRANIVRYLIELRDPRDADVAIRACDCYEKLQGMDVAYELRTLGLRLLAAVAPDRFPYYAAEHLDDIDTTRGHNEPAATAVSILAAMGHYAVLYQWLLGASRSSAALIIGLEAFSGAPPEFVARVVDGATSTAINTDDETLCTVLAETVVQLELASCYSAIEAMLSAKISDELYGYLAMLAAATDRAPLLAILQRQLHRGRRPRLIEAAFRVRTTPAQAAILKLWEDGEELPAMAPPSDTLAR